MDVKLKLEKIQFALSNYCSVATLADMQLYEEEQPDTGMIVQQFTARFLGRKVHEENIDPVVIEYPATWWQAFKQAFFPARLLRWTPVRLKRTEVARVRQMYHMCPHLDFATPKHEHFLWLGGSGKQEGDNSVI